MHDDDAQLARRIAAKHMIDTGRVKTAGEIRFIKDPGDPDGRAFPKEFKFEGRAKKPLAKTLWSISCALGHLVSSYSTFTKIKAVSISPDGKLGGKGYVQEVKQMRQDLNSAIETLSAIQDTINDELKGPHWQKGKIDIEEQDEAEVEEMLSDAEEISADPEGYVEKEYQGEVVDDI